MNKHVSEPMTNVILGLIARGFLRFLLSIDEPISQQPLRPCRRTQPAVSRWHEVWSPRGNQPLPCLRERRKRRGVSRVRDGKGNPISSDILKCLF